MASVRMFNGKRFFERTVHNKKKTANDKAASLRKKGFMVRVVKTAKSSFTGRPTWTVYARKKGR